MYSNSYFFVIGGFDGQKVNDMYRIKLFPVVPITDINQPEEEVKYSAITPVAERLSQ
jgi:hypothetical protein